MTRSDGGGQRSGSADSDLGPAGGPVQLYVLRLCAQAWPRFTTPSSAGGTRFPQVAGAARPARLVARKRRAWAASTICIVWARFPFVRKLAATSSPNLVARVDDRSQVSSRNFADPQTATRAIGRCEATDAIPTRARRRRPIPRRSGRMNSCDGMRCGCRCVCAAVQVVPILRIPPRKPCDLSGGSLTTRTRRLHAVSTWRGSRNGTNLPCAQA